MELKLDLHVHSRRSPDGIMSLEEIVARGRAAGLDGIAVCDHDRCVEDLPYFPGFLLIPGIEVSTDHGHLLGLFVRESVSVRELPRAVEAIHEQGGIAVLAHPFQRSRDPERIAPIAPLLDGVEVWNSRAPRKIPEANALALRFAAVHGLGHFGGSDAHVPQEIGNGVTLVQAGALTLEAAREALLQGNAKVHGRRSRAWFTARSQYEKLKRTGAGPGAYLKWSAFALKCRVEDVVRKDR